MKYLYITANCKPTDPITSFRMVTGKVLKTLSQYAGKIVYRIHIPQDLKLSKYSCDEYYTVDDENEKRLISDFQYNVYVFTYNGKWKVLSKGIDPKEESTKEFHKWRQLLMEGSIKKYKSIFHDL